MKRSPLVTAALVLAVLAGRVTDATTGQPLPHVTIAIGSHHANTDAHGAYRLTGLSPGRHTLLASSDDVPPQRRDIVVKAQGADTILNLVLCSTTLDYGCGAAGPG
ncbi:MAG: carboxypeptidase-like regulatory domain-containing protein [Candidatus Tumulicola sp.]